ncbi:mitochondrial carrier domain-containing protein [Daldinia sp. FL1419]|nr:mitochondrial carrier domain-containing protein [Daldinia sp. FL1419]
MLPALCDNIDPMVTVADNLLPALHHAVSGSAGTLISTCTLYPLYLAITRLQAQGRLRRETRLSASSGGTTPTGPGEAPGPARERAGITEAFSQIWNSGGGPRALYTGLAQDAAKSALDSFLFFLFYEWLRGVGLATGSRSSRRRAERSVTGLGVLEELAIGVVAGVCSKLFTTPISNIVARKQTGALTDEGRDASIYEIIEVIQKEQGLTGLWSGYPASLVFTLNPSITFFLQEFLKRKTVSADRWDNPGAHVTFLLAAISKTIASTITYPFQTAQTRQNTDAPAAPQDPNGEAAQQSPAEENEGPAKEPAQPHVSFDEAISPKTEVPRKVTFKENVAPPEQIPGAESGYKSNALRAVKSFGKRSVFGIMVHIARTEGIGALYDGIFGELVKSFLGHGTTMVAKDAVHKLLFKLYFVVAGALAEIRARKARAGVRGRMGDVARPVARTETRTETEVTVRRVPEPKARIPALIEARPSTPPSSSPARTFSPPPSPPSSAIERPPSSPLSLPEAPTPPPNNAPAPFALPPQHQPASPPPSLSLRLAPTTLESPPTPPSSTTTTTSSTPQHQLHSLRYRYDNNYDRYRYERLPSPPPTPYPAAGSGYRWTPRNHTGGRSFLAEDGDVDDDDGGSSMVANMIDSTQRGVKYY